MTDAKTLTLAEAINLEDAAAIEYDEAIRYVYTPTQIEAAKVARKKLMRALRNTHAVIVALHPPCTKPTQSLT